MQIIKPTVGRKVWYRPTKFDTQGPGGMVVSGGQPLDATVLAVWGDRLVNVLVFDIAGKPFTKTSVKLVQPDDAEQVDMDGNNPGGYVEWMPYQAAQAAKGTEANPLTEADAAADLAGLPRPTALQP